MVLPYSGCSWRLRVDKATLNAMDREKVTKERRMTEGNRHADWTELCRVAEAWADRFRRSMCTYAG